MTMLKLRNMFKCIGRLGLRRRLYLPRRRCRTLVAKLKWFGVDRRLLCVRNLVTLALFLMLIRIRLAVVLVYRTVTSVWVRSCVRVVLLVRSVLKTVPPRLMTKLGRIVVRTPLHCCTNVWPAMRPRKLVRLCTHWRRLTLNLVLSVLLNCSVVLIRFMLLNRLVLCTRLIATCRTRLVVNVSVLVLFAFRRLV